MDSAFPTAAYPSMTTLALETAFAAATDRGDASAIKMRAELDRRAKVRAGDRSVMTPGERLRTA